MEMMDSDKMKNKTKKHCTVGTQRKIE